jgi:hypothetical protein
MARRHNPMSVDFLKSMLRQWSGGLSGEARKDADALVALCDADPTFAESFTTAVNAKLEKRAAAKAAASEAAKAEKSAAAAVVAAVSSPASSAASSAALTDQQGWTMLADLVDTALPDLTAEEREALKAAFRAEAASAAA